jgi:VanZ family protein
VTLSSRTAVWLPPLALMALIFLLSAQPHLNSGLGVVDLVGRKLVHFGEYALLCFLWWRAFQTTSLARLAIPVALCLTIAYAGTDEFHQRFVSGRHSSPIDVAIDATGALFGAALAGRRR